MSTQSIQSQDIKISDVFQGFYSVPDYQREYVWQSEQVEQLTTDRCVTSERNGSELECQLFSTSVYCELVEVGLERCIRIAIDPNMSMPFRWTTS